MLKIFIFVFIFTVSFINADNIDKKILMGTDSTFYINFNDLKITELIKITSRILEKNILYNSNIEYDVDFISSSKLTKDDLYEILQLSLKQNGFELVKSGRFLRVVPKVKKQNDPLLEDSLLKTKIEIVELKNANASHIFKIVQGFIDKDHYKDKNIKTIISVDKDTNSIIVQGTQNYINYIKSFITKLDLPREQVYVKAKIMEISELKIKDIGVKYGMKGFSSGGNYLASFASTLNGFGSLDLLKDLTPSLKNGISLGAAINLLNQEGAANIISEPSILCINNKESSIYVGETRSIKIGTTTTSGGNTNDTFKREDIGLRLKVKPRVSKDNKVLLNISAVIEDVASTVTNDQPNTTKKDIFTTAIVNNGESVILGGYIKQKNEKNINKVPFLGEIPLLGSVFSNTTTAKDNINLVIVITPYIVPKSKNITFIRNKLSDLKDLENKFANSAIEYINGSFEKSNQEEDDKYKQRKHNKRIKEIFGI